MLNARRSLATGLLGLACAFAAPFGDASAQQVFRILGPDGKVTFSDQAPPSGASPAANAPAVRMSGAASGPDANGMPFALREVTGRYPVTLYTGNTCAPCMSGRAMLVSRGIPFTEKTVTTPDDGDAFKRLSGGSVSLPLLTIGGQQLKGFSDDEWSRYLDAAGYPKVSVLPPNYRNAPASPLVALQPAPASPVDATAAAAPPATAAAPVPARPSSPGRSRENPAGITF